MTPDPKISTPFAPLETGRRFAGRLVRDADLSAAINALCRRIGLRAAAFSARGTVNSATVGVFDPFQQVYVTHHDDRAMEIAACRGTWDDGEAPWNLYGQILLAAADGALTGGRLFSETRVHEGEVELLELLEPAPRRRYDSDTGVAMWSFDTPF